MEQDHLYAIWDAAFENEHQHTEISLIMNEPILIFSRIFGTTLYKPKIAAIIINSFLNYVTTEKNLSYKTFTSHLQDSNIAAIKNLLLSKDYPISKKDEHLFACSQIILSKNEKIIFQANNINNPTFKEFSTKYKIQTIAATNFDDVFKTVISMLNNKALTFQKINAYIEENSLIWNSKIANLKNNWLPQKYNEQILEKIHELGRTTILKDNSEEAKKFLTLSGTTLDGFQKQTNLLTTFIPWFMQNAGNEEWDKFTKNWENKPQLKRGKSACEFITNERKGYVKQLTAIVSDYEHMIYDLISDNTHPERSFWWTKVFLNDAQHYAHSPENGGYAGQKNTKKKSSPITRIPDEATNSQLDFIEWLYQTKFMSQQNYDDIKPLLFKTNLETKISEINKTNRTNKI